VERRVIHYHMILTIFTEVNVTALHPTAERCSLHYLLLPRKSDWGKEVEFTKDGIRNFTLRSISQTAFIVVEDADPLYLHNTHELWMFQGTAGHFFLDSRTRGIIRSILRIFDEAGMYSPFPHLREDS
jgi:hypothetical protein